MCPSTVPSLVAVHFKPSLVAPAGKNPPRSAKAPLRLSALQVFLSRSFCPSPFCSRQISEKETRTNSGDESQCISRFSRNPQLDTMERAETSEFTERNDESPLSSSDGSVTLVQAEEVSREATITTEIKGRNINSSFDVKERYLMQRATVPNQNIFK